MREHIHNTTYKNFGCPAKHFQSPKRHTTTIAIYIYIFFICEYGSEVQFKIPCSIDLRLKKIQEAMKKKIK